jgi:hypothetical protein
MSFSEKQILVTNLMPTQLTLFSYSGSRGGDGRGRARGTGGGGEGGEGGPGRTQEEGPGGPRQGIFVSSACISEQPFM